MGPLGLRFPCSMSETRDWSQPRYSAICRCDHFRRLRKGLVLEAATDEGMGYATRQTRTPPSTERQANLQPLPSLRAIERADDETLVSFLPGIRNDESSLIPSWLQGHLDLLPAPEPIGIGTFSIETDNISPPL